MICISCPVQTEALTYAIVPLQAAGLNVLTTCDPAATHLLLPVPCKLSHSELEALLQQLPNDITVLGGNLNYPALTSYTTIDILQDPIYVSKNADITAHCALKLASNAIFSTLADCKALVIGWGRIGKCLARLLRYCGAAVTVSARKVTDRAMLEALGYKTQNIPDPTGFDLIFNTVPVMVLPECPKGPLYMDLASVPGMDGEDIIWARGLPNRLAPASSGKLIAETLLRILNKE